MQFTWEQAGGSFNYGIKRSHNIKQNWSGVQDGGQADPKASEYESNIWIQKEERKANAKSLLGLLSLGISPGDRITIITDGRDEETALNELEAFAEKGMTD